MMTRRGVLLAAATFMPSVAWARKKRKLQQTGAKYVAVIHDAMSSYRDEARNMVAAYSAGLSPYGVAVSYVAEGLAACAEDAVICDSPHDSPQGYGGYGRGWWSKSRDGWTIRGDVEVFPLAYQGYDPGQMTRLFCHEVGHVFGLGHEPIGADSCMQDAGMGTVGPYQFLTGPSQSDIANIVALLPRGKSKSKKKRRKK